MADKSLLQFILDLLRDPEKLQEFKDDPKGALSACGLQNVTPEQVHDAIVLASDNDHVSFDRDYNTGGNHVAGASVPPPPPPASHADHDAGVKYLDKYVTNNYITNNIDDRDTIIDQSVNQNIDTHGGDFNQTIDNHSVNATGDGAVAAGGDIKDSTITTGHGNVVGDGNHVVNGNDNTTAFGEGSAVRDVNVKDGSAFSVNGDSSADSSTNDSFNKTHTETTDIDKTINSHNTDTDSSVHTDVDNHSHTDLLSHNNVDLHLPVL
ncbi:IniB N-terminal domain-containing protein [Pseudonocardia endophytica]|uniref:Uncharacterized protein n=1 Tax=Pseudonocardia endophytica TaxID=401976 RepID=A0A4R1HY63_PSEEN|nr:IniB N-terminal domain-containing protein [Pseudonocardia endophytica]TCK27754.1 hypothetical protein EV378_3632 [Pseudonocardia endophytica]